MDQKDREMQGLKRRLENAEDKLGIRRAPAVPKKELVAELDHLREKSKRSLTLSEAHRIKELENALGQVQGENKKKEDEEKDKK